jgi:hypothetical protein
MICPIVLKQCTAVLWGVRLNIESVYAYFEVRSQCCGTSVTGDNHASGSQLFDLSVPAALKYSAVGTTVYTGVYMYGMTVSGQSNSNTDVVG